MVNIMLKRLKRMVFLKVYRFLFMVLARLMDYHYLLVLLELNTDRLSRP